jgi:hypothetical protein
MVECQLLDKFLIVQAAGDINLIQNDRFRTISNDQRRAIGGLAHASAPNAILSVEAQIVGFLVSRLCELAQVQAN